MYQCITQEVPCLENDYAKFDDICRRELARPISVNEIINESTFCTSLSIDKNTRLDGLDLNDYLTGLRGKTGLYHLWIEIGNCQDHHIHSLLGVYVGKGIAKNRILSHAKTKWPETQLMYISFYECENRLAKYLEQLFLDTYRFYLNADENCGTGSLYARWSEERFLLGTELFTVSEVYANKMGDALYDLLDQEPTQEKV